MHFGIALTTSLKLPGFPHNIPREAPHLTHEVLGTTGRQSPFDPSDEEATSRTAMTGIVRQVRHCKNLSK
jgi:hypothetical protein